MVFLPIIKVIGTLVGGGYVVRQFSAAWQRVTERQRMQQDPASDSATVGATSGGMRQPAAARHRPKPNVVVISEGKAPEFAPEVQARIQGILHFYGLYPHEPPCRLSVRAKGGYRLHVPIELDEGTVISLREQMSELLKQRVVIAVNQAFQN